MAALSSCGTHDRAADGAAGPKEESEAVMPPGVFALPSSVRENLGISFVPVERRRVADTMRLPGRFESAPEARAEYRAAARGSIELAVSQYQRVEPGDLLYRLEGGAWRDAQIRLLAAEMAAATLDAKRPSVAAAVSAAERAVELQRKRLADFETLVATGAAEFSQIAEASSDLAEAEADLAAALGLARDLALEASELADPVEGNRRLELALREAALLTARDTRWLLEQVDGAPRWRGLRSIEVTARKPGVVAKVATADGGLVAEGDLVVETVDLSAVRFRGFALQADLGRVEDGAEVAIVPPHGGIATYGDALRATLALGVEADPEERTIDLLATPLGGEPPAWARPGVAAFVEVVMAGGDDPELAIPLGAVVRDGLERVFFLRDREDADTVRRVVGDLGADDGRWVVVNSGVRPGDQVVLDGVYELLLTAGAGSGPAAEGGHFHSDGTFHTEGD
ncbi:MAG: hypothetical protein SF028_01000 [Candidatus Sumerlaeia bacterium]|nr:hypothetical protein [Candidatus Sumerlaeia bacterium]